MLTVQVMKDISEVRKIMDTTQEMFEPLHQMIVMLKQHGVDVSGVEVAEKNVQVKKGNTRRGDSPNIRNGAPWTSIVYHLWANINSLPDRPGIPTTSWRNPTRRTFWRRPQCHGTLW